MLKRLGFRPIPFAAMVVVVVIGILMGNWQARRAEQKIALGARLVARNSAAPLILGPQPVNPDAIELRRVAVTGRFVPGWALYLDNRPYNGRAGFYLLMPFQIAGSTMHVLVERGWLPRNTAERDRLPAVPTPAGMVTITGVARLNTGHVMQLGSPPPLKPGAIVQNADIGQVGAASGLALQPFVLEQGGAAGQDDGQLVRDWPAPSLGVDMHRGYEFQWYALALTAFLFYGVTGLKRGTN
ncbi:MAG TPA: SURF1 family protein [Janthinobacterium sp.]|nr:SURF1 family protein [Janthinobacterium sp.]